MERPDEESAPVLKKDTAPSTKDQPHNAKNGSVNFTAGSPDEYKFYPDEPLHVKHKYAWISKEPSKFYDPCQECRKASLDCIMRNQKDRLVCLDFFEAYRDCKKDFFANRAKEKRLGKGGWGWR